MRPWPTPSRHFVVMATVPVWIAWIFISFPSSVSGISACGAKPREDQLDDAFGELVVDRPAGDQQAVEERPAEDVEGELEIEVGSEVAAIDAALEDLAQRRAAPGEEPLADGAGKLGALPHGGDEAGHHPGLERRRV